MMLAVDDAAAGARSGPGVPPVAGTGAGQSGLFGDLLDRFTEIVGPAASEATFHFASLQEGMRLGAGHGPRELPQALSRVDAVVGQRSRVLSDDDRAIRIAVSGSALLASGNPVRQAVVRGLLEGLLRSVRGKAFSGRILPGHPAPTGAAPGETVLEFSSEAPFAAS